MSKVTIDLIKELRERTGSGMSDCKKALEETSGNVEEAIDYLRKKGLASAAKKAGRVTSEGVISVLSNNETAILLEVNSETDFVAKNDKFLSLVNNVSNVAINSGASSLESLLEQKYGDNLTVAQALSEAIAVIGENLTIRRFEKLDIKGSLLGSYVHNKVEGFSNLGKIGVIVSFDKAPKDNQLPDRIAMHISAMKPISLSVDDLDPSVLEREKEVQKDLILQSGKSPEVAEKMMEGRLRKFYEASCLLNQSFIMDDSKTVQQILKDNDTSIKGFKLLVLGEGVEKKEEDFAAEVAKITG